ncbi:MAG TPA: DMT family transporter [Gemmatimonadaceae bacterium]
MSTHRRRPELSLTTAIVAAILAFGSSFPSVKVALRSFAPGPLALARFIAASMALAVYFALRRRPTGVLREWRALVFLGVTNVAVYHILFNNGQKLVSPSAVSILVTTSPLWSSVIAVFVTGEHSRPRLWIGLGLAFIGAAAIAISERGAVALSPGALLVLAAAFLQGVSFIVQRPTVARIGALTTTAVAIWIGTAILALVYGREFMTELSAASMESIIASVYLGLVSSVVGLACWAYVLHRIPASEASPYLLVVPLVATAISLVMIGDVPRVTTLLGGVVTIAGVLISTRRATPAVLAGGDG